VQSRLWHTFAQHSPLSLVDGILDPVCYLSIDDIIAWLRRTYVTSRRIRLCLFCGDNLILVFFGNSLGFDKWREPWVLKEHGIRRPRVGDLIQTAAYKVARCIRETFVRKIRRLAVNNSLHLISKSSCL
jgi:hypothetical protein